MKELVSDLVRRIKIEVYLAIHNFVGNILTKMRSKIEYSTYFFDTGEEINSKRSICMTKMPNSILGFILEKLTCKLSNYVRNLKVASELLLNKHEMILDLNRLREEREIKTWNSLSYEEWKNKNEQKQD